MDLTELLDLTTSGIADERADLFELVYDERFLCKINESCAVGGGSAACGVSVHLDKSKSS